MKNTFRTKKSSVYAEEQQQYYVLKPKTIDNDIFDDTLKIPHDITPNIGSLYVPNTSLRQNNFQEQCYQDCKRNVRFSDVSVRFYACQLGDNPTCSVGPPISLSWTYVSDISISVDEFEKTKRHTRKLDELIIPAFTRIKMLRRNGYSLQEILNTVSEIRKQRSYFSTRKRLMRFFINLRTYIPFSMRTIKTGDR